MSKRTVDMTTGSPAKHILTFAVPLALTNIGQQLYMIADGAIVGRGVGVKALAAVGATDWSYWLVLWSVIGLAQGISTFVSRAFGEKNYREMNKSIATAMVLCAIIGTVLTVGGVIAAKPVLKLLNTPKDILPGATAYLQIMVAGTLIIMAYNMAASILRALGDGKTPLIAMVISAVLNIGLDCLFVFVFDWGIIGAAVASLVAQAVSFVYCFVVIARIDCVCLDKEARKIEFKRLKNMLLFGLPVSMQYVVICLGGMILQSSINLQGSIFIAGYTATNKLHGLLESFAMAFGYSCSTFVAQNFGAGRYDRVKKGVADTVKIVSVIALAITAIALLSRWQILRIFMDVNQEGGLEALETAVQYLTIMVSCFLVLYILHVFRNTLEAMGIAAWSMVSGVAEFLARASMAKLALYWANPNVLFASEPAAWFAAMLSVLLPYLVYRKTRLKIE